MMNSVLGLRLGYCVVGATLLGDSVTTMAEGIVVGVMLGVSVGMNVGVNVGSSEGE